jgi:catechol 2,3-dioxygenase-like lactoylglutathione lyase family enzyme
MARLISVQPVSGEDPKALPVKALDPAIDFYRNVLGFSLVHRDASTAIVARDDVRIGLELRENHDPARAGSLALEVDELEAMHDELRLAGGRPGEFGIDEWGGQSHRTFFLIERENGYCYCFFRPLGNGAM